MIKEIRELIAIYLIRFTFWILPNGDLKNSYAKFSYDLMIKDLSRTFKMNANIKRNETKRKGSGINKCFFSTIRRKFKRKC